jgi:predicted DNA-binding transcriptional regulator YafY
MIDRIESAIRRRVCIELDYLPGIRIIEPHALGISKDGDVLLRAYQISGASASGEHENWKLFRVDRISGLSESTQTFAGPRPQYNPNDSAMKQGVIACL